MGQLFFISCEMKFSMDLGQIVAESILTKVEFIALLNFSVIHWSLSKTMT